MSVIDILKVISVVAVVLIHVISAWHFSPTLIPLDQLMRFSVPLFVALSGYGLMVGYGTKKLDLRQFFLRRLGRLLPWYLFFATVSILLVTFVWHEQTALYHGLKLWRLYFFGQADYHLYFVPMVIQLYLLFPLLLFLFRRFPPILLTLLAFFWQAIWFYLIGQKTELIFNNNGLWPDQEQYRSAASWIFYFVLGMYMAGKRLPKWQLVVGLLAVVFGFVFSTTDSLTLLSKGMDIIVATRFTRLPVLIFATGTILTSGYFLGRFRATGKRTDLPYVVYLLHPLVLRALIKTPGFIVNTGLVGLGIATVFASFAIASLFVTGTAKIKAAIRP